MKNLARAGIDL
jgi:hypothetical protein